MIIGYTKPLYWLLSTSVREKGHLAMIPILFLSVRWDSAIDRGGESFSFTRETTGAMNSRSSRKPCKGCLRGLPKAPSTMTLQAGWPCPSAGRSHIGYCFRKPVDSHGAAHP